MAEHGSNGYDIEALIDSGSTISIMRNSVYTNFFPNYKLMRENNKDYGDINKSPLVIYGYVSTTIRFKLLPDNTFMVRFAVVPDSTMSYDCLLGRGFLKRPGLTVILNEVVEMRYCGFTNDIMNIEVTEEPNVLDAVREGLDPSLPMEAQDELFSTLQEYIRSKPDAGVVDYKLDIRLVDNAKPFYFTPRRLSWHERQEVDKMVRNLLNKGIIRPSNSEFSSPIVLVKKKDDTYRLCVNYRALNKITVKDRYSLPLIEDQIDRLAGNSYFTSLDLKDGFHHVPVAEESIKLTSFVTPDGQYEYLKMPFGLANAPAACQRFINLIFRPLLEARKVLLYLDDILIATPTIRENLTILGEVLHLMSRHKLELKFAKCKFLKQEIEYLGYIISKKGVTPNKINVDAIRNFPQPNSTRQVQSFLGLTSYFRKFVPNFSLIARPLYNLLC